MFPTLLYVLGGLLLLAVGAEVLVRGSTSIALRMGVTPLVIGLTVVAFGTGSPELAVSVEAAYRGNSGIALGNVVGSNISNIALILGVSALARPMRVRSALIRREMPLMIAVTLLLCLLLWDGSLSRFDGLLLVAGAVAYTAFAYVSARRDRNAAVAAEFDAGIKEISRPAWLDTTFVVMGFVSLLVGAKLLLGGATAVAESFASVRSSSGSPSSPSGRACRSLRPRSWRPRGARRTWPSATSSDRTS
jgi:cation:H+ antiporter